MIVNNLYSPLNFGTTYKKVYKKNSDSGEVNHESSTCFFKYDLQWNKFFNKVIEQYKATPKVNIYSLACSDGSEAYSIAMLLMTKLGDKADKYFPVKAVDFDEDVMTDTKNGYIYLSKEDEVKINENTKNQLNRFLERTDSSYITDYIGSSDRKEVLTKFKIKPELKNKVIFETSDINDYIDNIPNGNNIIFCRNCWPYLYNSSDEFTKKLSDKIDKNSYLVIGNYDSVCCPLNMTENIYGFSMKKDYWNVFDKSGENFFDNFRGIIHPDLIDDTP